MMECIRVENNLAMFMSGENIMGGEWYEEGEIVRCVYG